MMMQGPRRTALTIAGLLLTTACLNLESPTAATQGQLVVQSILNPGTTIQEILVHRVRTGTDTASNAATGSHDPAVIGAVITVTAPNGTVMAASEEATPGFYDFNPFTFGVGRITPGQAYSLHLRTSSGEEVSGMTTLPRISGRVSALPASRVFSRGRDTLHLSWTRAPGARSYELVIRSRETRHEYRTFADTSVSVPGTALTITGDEIFAFGDVVDVVLSAVDANYYDYYRAQSDPFAGAAPSHLVGAVGVFGSITPAFYGTWQVR